MSHETSARNNYRSGFNCAQSVFTAFAEEIGLPPAEAMQAAPAPRSEGGKCGAYLAGAALLAQLRPEAAAAFRERFLEENGAVECGKLRKMGKPCSDLVGSAARLTKELSEKE